VFPLFFGIPCMVRMEDYEVHWTFFSEEDFREACRISENNPVVEVRPMPEPDVMKVKGQG
jgi:hypothetical protein